jgi:hypothetical protein
LRAQLHGDVISPEFANVNHEDQELFNEISNAAPNFCKRLRRAVLTRVGDGCDCGRLCPQILKWTRPVRKLALYVAEGLLISSV